MNQGMGSQLRLGLRLLLGRSGMAKFIVGWLYALSLYYVVASQLRISSVAPAARVVPSTSASTGPAPDRNTTFASASLLSWPGLLLSSASAAIMEASTSVLQKAARFGIEDASRSLRVPTSAYYLNRTTHKEALLNRSEGPLSVEYDAKGVAPSSTVMAIKQHSTNTSDHDVPWAPLNWTSLPTPSEGRRRPILYVHAGPYKTATSFLQCVLSRNAYDYLKVDGVAYLGTCAHECKRPASSYDYCEVHSSQSFFTGDGEVTPQLREKLNELYDARQSALMVWEYFSDLHETKLRGLLKELKGWEIHVILNYRRLFEWLPSWYSQKHRPLRGRDIYTAWPGQSIASDDRILHSTGAVRFPFDVYSADVRAKMPFDNNYRQSIDILEKSKLHPVEHARRHWLRYAENATITVLSLHHLPKPNVDGDPLLTYLFCVLVPLDNTCRAARNHSLEILDVGSNARFPENYDMLAVHAHQCGLHPNGDASLQRPAVWKLIQGHQESTLNKTSRDFPLRCVSDASLDMLWNLSAETERSILTGLEDEHRNEFDRAVQRKEFCSVDVDQALKHDDWRFFFLPPTCVVPHVTERRNNGVWWPTWNTQYSIEQMYFSNMAGSLQTKRSASNARSVDVLGFVHVGQTKLARLVDLVRNVTMSNSLPLYECGGQPCTPTLDDPLIGCLFAKSSTGSGKAFAAGWQRRCPLSRFASVVEVWAKNLNYLDRTSSALDNSKTSLVGQKAALAYASIVPVTLIRDPLDRWVDTYQQWKSANWSTVDFLGTSSPLQTMINGSLEEFLRLASTVPYHNRTIGFLLQYQYLAVDVKRAIDLVVGSTPRVLVLIQECWDESLQLLALRSSFPEIHDTTAVEEKRLPRTKPIGDELNQAARQWLANEYVFYNAAIEQFLRYLAASNVTASLAETCARKLSQLGHRPTAIRV